MGETHEQPSLPAAGAGCLQPIACQASPWSDCLSHCKPSHHALHPVQEARSVLRARKAGVPTPTLYYVELDSSSIYMERVQGRSIRHLLADGLLDDSGGWHTYERGAC